MTPEQERQMKEVFENSRQTIVMNEDMDKWMQYCLEQGRLTTPDGAFAAGWNAAFVHRLSEMMEVDLGFNCHVCGHLFHVQIPVLMPKDVKK